MPRSKSTSTAKTQELELTDYLQTATESSTRVRFTVIILVVISVLTFAGFLNSWNEFAWSFTRIEALRDPTSKYSKLATEACDKIIGNAINAGNPALKTKEDCKEDRRVLYDSLLKSVVDNGYNLRVPFFGVGFDINDLELLSGFGFIIVLGMLRLAIRNYIISLRIGFKAAFNRGEAPDFYDILASRQLFVFPHLEDKNQSDNFEEEIEQLWKGSSIRTPILNFRAQLSLVKNELRARIIFNTLRALFGSNEHSVAEVILAILKVILMLELLLVTFLFGVVTVMGFAFGAFLLLAFIWTLVLTVKNYDRDIESTETAYWSSNPQPYLKRIPKLISMAPPLVFLLVIVNDYQSIEYAIALNPSRGLIGFIVSLMFLVAIAALSIWCSAKWSEIDAVWNEYRNRLSEVLPATDGTAAT